MSAETFEWLNRFVLVGQTDKRGNAWHYKASDQGDEPNHYPGFIPVADVTRRLFGFIAEEVPLAVLRAVTPDDPAFGAETVLIDGQLYRVVIDPTRKGIVPSDEDTILGVFKEGYKPHQYEQWLLKNVETILDDDLGITSAGLLRNRAIAWVEVSVPDNIDTPEGITFRPNLVAATSFDGSLATSYARTITATVCDNTLAAALGESKDDTYKVKHSKYSDLKIGNAREALTIIYKATDEFQVWLTEQCNTELVEKDWQRVLDELVPIPGEKGRARTLALNKREALDQLYHWDARVAPWKGTAFGAYQAFNTYGQHSGTVKNTFGGGRVERNLLNAVTGTIAKQDTKVLEVVGKVLAAA